MQADVASAVPSHPDDPNGPKDLPDFAPDASRARINRWLAEIVPHLNLKLDAQGLCSVGHESGLDCAIEVPDNAAIVCLRIPVAPLATLTGTQLRQCLATHLFGHATGGAAYGIDEEEEELVLWRTVGLAGLDAASFAAILVQLFDTARDSTLWLRSVPPAAASDTHHDARREIFEQRV